MILSESEKNRIRGLYNLVAEAETAPPPDESILVANKNPYKNDEFKNARKIYNVKLNDGERFFILDDNKFKSWVINYLNTNISGKDIRLEPDNSTGEDIIYTIEPFYHVIGTPPPYENQPTNKPSFFYVQTQDKNNRQFEIRVDLIKNTVEINLKLMGNKPFPYEHQRTSYTYWKSKDSSTIGKFHKIIVDNLSWENIPDDCFEVREIKRQQTDF